MYSMVRKIYIDTLHCKEKYSVKKIKNNKVYLNYQPFKTQPDFVACIYILSRFYHRG